MRAGLARIGGAIARLALVACGAACGAPRSPPSHRASERACPHDAVAVDGTCACSAGLAVLEGACVGVHEASIYCGGAAARVAIGAPASCVPAACASGDALDLARGACVPALGAREIAARERMIPGDAALACHEGSALAASREHVICLPRDVACPRTTRWDPVRSACAPELACRAGEVAAAGACVPLVARGGGSAGSAVLDVGQWTRAVLGADGGDASDRVCRALAQAPWAFGVGPGGARAIAIEVGLVFPDNDVTQVVTRIDARDAATRELLASDAAATVRAAVDPLFTPLRAIGGTADAAGVTVRVQCRVAGGATPLVMPR